MKFLIFYSSTQIDEYLLLLGVRYVHSSVLFKMGYKFPQRLLEDRLVLFLRSVLRMIF